jgi:hypothetical protein
MAHKSKRKGPGKECNDWSAQCLALLAQRAPEANGAILILQGGANKGIKAFDRDGKPWQVFVRQ